MSRILSAAGLSKSFGPKNLFTDISLNLSQSDRVGLLGPNGAGKTTLLRLLLGDLEPDVGQVSCSSDLLLGYLPQQVLTEDPACRAREFAMQAVAGLADIEQELHYVERQLAEASEGALPALLQAYSALQQVFERRQGYSFDQQLAEVLEGLRLSDLNLERSCSSFSGGELSRLRLAGLLVQQPDVLLLDEPTNHLDWQALEWLEEYLSSYPYAVLLVSHDRRFLDRTVNTLLEMEPATQTMSRFSGSYSDYLVEKEQRRQRVQKEYEEYTEEVRRLRSLIKQRTYAKSRPGRCKDGNKMAYDKRGERHQQGESRTIAQARSKLAELEATPIPRPVKRTVVGLRFQPEPLQSSIGMEVRDLFVTVEQRTVVQDWSTVLAAGDRLCIVGPNGSGKTTLLRILAGHSQPVSGSVILNPSARVGYLTQHAEQLPHDQTVLQVYGSLAEGDEAKLRADLAKYGLFGDEQVHLPVQALSLGQRQKLQIALLIASRANVLLLDEPTNHLDLETLSAFEKTLTSFPGIIIAVSHDRWFVEAMQRGGRASAVNLEAI